MNTHTKINPILFNQAFQQKFTLKVAGYDEDFVNGIYTNELISAGFLKLNSGEIIFGDTLSVYVVSRLKPFLQTVSPGEYRVDMCILVKDDIKKVAFTRVNFRENVFPTYYDIATVAGDDISKLAPTEIFGAGIDAGVGGYLDASVAAKYDDLLDEENYNKLFDALTASSDKIQLQYLSYTIDQETGQNVVMTSTGYGDGVYASYFGYNDESKNPINLITDFYVIPWNLEEVTLTFIDK